MLIKPFKLFITHLCWIYLIAYSAGCSSAHKARSISENNSSVQTRLKRIVKAGEIHRYRISLKPNEFVHLKVQQYDIDVIAKVSSANNEWKEVFDMPTGELDAEDIYLLSDTGSKYEMEIYPAQKYADPGEYDIRIVRLVKASEADKKWMIALTATQKADKMRAKAETRQQSIQQYESALIQWKGLKDTTQYARAMRSMGFMHIREKNYEKAIEIFNQLLPIWKQLGDTRSEGFTYLIIGRVYDLQKNYGKSLEYNLASLEYWKRAKDTDQESFVLMNIGNLYSRLSDKQKAIDFFEQALKKNEQSERPSVKAVILRDYATAMLSVSEKEKAAQLYEQSFKQWQSTANTSEEARTAVLLATYFAEKNELQKAIHYYQYALEIWKKLDEQKEIKNIQAALDKLEK